MVFCNSLSGKSVSSYSKSHNPYFNRWFSAIDNITYKEKSMIKVTILILIDGFLQFGYLAIGYSDDPVTILILIDGFLQFNMDKNKKEEIYVTILILIDGFLQ